MVDYNEAIKNLQTINGMPLTIRLAIEALEKQIPKKPKETDAYPHRLYCPYCTWTLCYNKENADSFRMMHMFRYCPECGQAIDWSDE